MLHSTDPPNLSCVHQGRARLACSVRFSPMFCSIFTSSSSLTGASHPPNEWHPKSSQTQPSVDQGWHVLGFLPAADNFLFQKVLGRVLFRLVPTKPIVLTTHCWRWWCWWSVKTVNCSDHGNDDDDHDHAVSLLPVHWTSVESDKTLVWPNALSVITPCRQRWMDNG